MRSGEAMCIVAFMEFDYSGNLNCHLEIQSERKSWPLKDHYILIFKKSTFGDLRGNLNCCFYGV
jgi:hypothetical protein